MGILVLDFYRGKIVHTTTVLRLVLTLPIFVISVFSLANF